MEFSGLSDETRKTFNIKQGVRGVVVTSVEAGSPAAERGLKAGDVIEEVNHQAVERPSDVAKALEGARKTRARSRRFCSFRTAKASSALSPFR